MLLMNILIFGANWYNRGDEAALRAMIDEIKEQLPEAQFMIHFNQKVDSIPYPNVEIVPSFTKPMGRNFLKKTPYLLSLKSGGKFNFMKGEQKNGFERFMQAVNWADYAIYSPGGPSIGEHYRQFHLVDMMYLLKRNDVPFSIFAPSVGPFKNFKNYISRTFSYAEVICFREEISNEYYEGLNPQKKAIVTLDSAFQHPINMADNDKIFSKYKELKDYINVHQKTIGITVTDLKWHRDYRDSNMADRIRESFIEIVHILSQEGYGIVFIPQCFEVSNDSDYMRSFSNKGCLVMSDQYDCYFQQYVISKLYAVIGMRYHSNIFSAKMGTPFISVAYEQKMTGFIKKAGLEKYCVPISDLSAKIIYDKFLQLEDDYDNYKKMLEHEKDQFAVEAHKTTDLIMESICNLYCKGE